MNKTYLLKEIRSLTQASMKDCKDALEESNWVLTKAIDIVKAKGLSNTARNTGKIASEGILIFSQNTNRVSSVSSMIEINCQTDFVAKSSDFLSFSEKVSKYFESADIFSFTGILSDDLELARKEVMASTKENIVVRRWFALETIGSNRTIARYVHSNSKLGVLVSLESPNTSAPEFLEFADGIAMQIAAMNPLAVSREALLSSDIERQKIIFTNQIESLNKNTAASAKILEGKFNKWYTDVCLVDQESVLHPKISVGEIMKNISNKLGGEVKILEFIRANVGEGLAKKQDDLARDVFEVIESSK